MYSCKAILLLDLAALSNKYLVLTSYKLTAMKLQNIWVIRHVQACKGEMLTMYRQKYDGMKWLRNKTQWAILACNLADAKICNLR